MLKGYRTIIFNVIMGVIAVVHAMGGFGTSPGPTETDVGTTVDAVMVAIDSVWALGNVILRAITTSPIFSKEVPSA